MSDALDRVRAALNADTVDRLRTALERGRWPDGSLLSEAQKEHCMEAVLVWEAQHLPEEQRVGYIDKGSKAGEQCDDPQQPQSLKWKEDN